MSSNNSLTVDFSSLTLKQKKVYYAIETFIKSKGIPPTVREIGELVGERTPGAVQGILNRLEQKGVIKREIGMARSIQLVSNNSQYITPHYIPEIKKISRRNIDDLLNIYNVLKYHPISPDVVSMGINCFIISCPDNSLIESGIKYEDLLVVDRDAELSDGDVIIVMYENHVLLRFYHVNQQQNTVTLKADSNLLNKETFNRDEITIVGKVICKITKF